MLDRNPAIDCHTGKDRRRKSMAEKKKRTIFEEIEVTGNQLVDRVKELAKEGSVRQLKIKASDGDVFLETPLNLGLAVGGVVVLAAPWLALLGALAALVTKVTIEIEREEPDDSAASSNASVGNAKEPASPKTKAP
jgi:hypothetical protein